MSVRDGVNIKLRREVHQWLLRLASEYTSKYGRRITYSDIIEALLKRTKNPMEVINEYLKNKEMRR